MRLSQRTGLPAAGLWLLAGTFVTTIGNGVQAFAVGKLLFDLTGSVAAFGVVIIVEQAVNVLMQLIAGPWVDRGDPRRTSVQVELARGACICVASLLLGADTLFAWVVVMTLVIRVAQPFYRAATFSLAPAVVPPDALTRFNGYSNIALQAGQLVGVAVAGVVLERWGATPAFFLNGVSFLASAATLMLIRAPRVDRAPVSRRFEAELIQAWTEIATLLRREAGLAWHLVLSTADSVAIYLFNLVIVAVIAERHADSAEWLSAVEISFAVGAIASGFVVDRWTTRLGSGTVTLIGIAGQSAGFAALGLLTDARLTVPVAFALGACNTLSWTVVMTTLQLRVGKSVKGRIGTARNLLTALFAVALVPLVSRMEATSLELALIGCGAVCFGFAAIVLLAGVALFGAPARRAEALP